MLVASNVSGAEEVEVVFGKAQGVARVWWSIVRSGDVGASRIRFVTIVG